MDDAYAELHCHSNFSFLDGASHPEELAEEAVRLGLAALAITDHDGFYGVVRFAEAARAVDLPTVFGAELTLGRASSSPTGFPIRAGEHLIVLAQGPVGYARLAKAISEAQLAGEKGAPRTSLAQLADAARAPVHLAGNVAARENDHWFVLTGCRKGSVPAALQRDGPAAAQTRAGRAGRRVRSRPGARRAVGPRRSARPAPQRRARADRVAGRRGSGRDQQRALRHARAPPARDRARRGAFPSFARRGRRLAAGRIVRAPAQPRASSSAGSRAGRARSSARSRSRARARST